MLWLGRRSSREHNSVKGIVEEEHAFFCRLLWLDNPPLPASSLPVLSLTLPSLCVADRACLSFQLTWEWGGREGTQIRRQQKTLGIFLLIPFRKKSKGELGNVLYNGNVQCIVHFIYFWLICAVGSSLGGEEGEVEPNTTKCHKCISFSTQSKACRVLYSTYEMFKETG